MGTNQRADVVMTDTEVWRFLERSRTATLATTGPGGLPHLAAMWYGVVGRRLCFTTKVKSQKAVNLRRDPSIAVLVEAGDSYDALRGVSIEGAARLLDDPADPEYWAAAVSVFERYHEAFTDATRERVEATMRKRVVIWVEPVRIRSWDHRRLHLDPAPITGSTAPFLHHE